MERMIINLKKEIRMLRDKLLSTGVIMEPSMNITENDCLLENTALHDNSSSNQNFGN